MKRSSTHLYKLGALLVAIVLVTALTGLAQAQQRGPRPGGERPDRDEMMNKMISRLDLNDEQQEQMKQIHEQHREETEGLLASMKTAHERLNELMDADTFDEAAIREAAGEVSKIQTELFVSRAKVQQEIRQILTPEQYEQLKQMRERHHGMMGHPGDFDGDRPHHGWTKPAPEDG